MLLVSDWFVTKTITEFEKDIGKFKNFKGEGWYFQNGDTILVTRTSSTKLRADKSQLYLFLVWNGFTPVPALCKLLSLPVRANDGSVEESYIVN